MSEDSAPKPAPLNGNGAQPQRRESFISHNSQTASEFINEQLRLEADAREALPYSFDSCTRPLGSLRQTLFACLTCNPPAEPDAPYIPAAVCYSCSISCHGEHNLVELFTKRNFICDCGTRRLPSTAPCVLRADPKTGAKGVASEEPAADNQYNHNFKNKFCGCDDSYDPHQEKGTMFQCLGLGTVETGGCGEDWWHPECLVGLTRDQENQSSKPNETPIAGEGAKGETDTNAVEVPPTEEESEDPALPPGFPGEDDFETFICYKCLDSNPWLKIYAGTPGFLPPVYKQKPQQESPGVGTKHDEASDDEPSTSSKKRKLEEDGNTHDAKRVKEEVASESTVEQQAETTATSTNPEAKKHDALPTSSPKGTFSLFLKEDFRDHLCHCPTCFPRLKPHFQLREEEEVYEPPLSENGEQNGNNSAGSAHTGSLLDRGEAALSNVDRVRAIEGVMVYNHLRDKVKQFLTPFAESGQAVGAEDIKSYFEKLRGDDQGIREASGQASASKGEGNNEGDDGNGNGNDTRKEQSGY